MTIFFSIPNWQEIFVPQVPLAETIIRGSVLYLGLVIFLRVILKRETGSLGVSDLLMVMLLSESAQNAMATNVRSVMDGLLLALVVILWSLFIDWLSFRFPAIQRLISPSALPLIKEGVILRKNLRKELVTLEELMAALRENGVEDVRSVKAAFMESDGRISVVAADVPSSPPPSSPRDRG